MRGLFPPQLGYLNRIIDWEMFREAFCSILKVVSLALSPSHFYLNKSFFERLALDKIRNLKRPYIFTLDLIQSFKC